MKNTLDTRLAPGAVLISCRAGRMVLAVVDCTGNQTVYVVLSHHHGTQYDGILQLFACIFRSQAFGFAQFAHWLNVLLNQRSRIDDFQRIRQEMPRSFATASTSSRVANSTQRAMPFRDRWRRRRRCVVLHLQAERCAYRLCGQNRSGCNGIGLETGVWLRVWPKRIRLAVCRWSRRKSGRFVRQLVRPSSGCAVNDKAFQ